MPNKKTKLARVLTGDLEFVQANTSLRASDVFNMGANLIRRTDLITVLGTEKRIINAKKKLNKE